MPDGSIISANLVYRDRPVLILESGEEIVDDNGEITYEMTHEWIIDKNGETQQVPLPKSIVVSLKSELNRVKKYSRLELEDPQDIYPHSSNDWYGKLIRGKENALYIVQDTDKPEKMWLTIIAHDLSRIYQSHKINRYEFDMLRLKTSYDYFYEMTSAYSVSNPEGTKKEILKILDEESLSWNEINNITRGSIPPSFKRGKTIRDTLIQLVNIEKYPVDAHEEILAFLAWVAKDKMPDRDIVDFVSSMRVLPTFRTLISQHFKFILDDLQPPHYLQIANEVTSDIKTEMVLEESAEKEPKAALSKEIVFRAPDWQNEIVDIARLFSESNEIVTAIPGSKIPLNQAEISQKKRYVIAEWGLRLRTHVKPRSLGLHSILYIGRAHRWPTNHFAFSARLGALNQPVPYLQSMVMPPNAAEKVKRALPTVVDIGLDILKLNLNLYNNRKGIWTTRTNPILKSIEKTTTYHKIGNEFDSWAGKDVYNLSSQEARIIDMSSHHFYLTDLTRESARKYWKTDAEKSRTILTSLRDSNVVDISYWFQFRQALSKRVILTIEGSEGRVCSLSRAMLKECPTSRVMIEGNGKSAIVMSRISDETVDFFANILPNSAKEVGLKVECYFPSLFRNYTPGLYQRLLQENGEWDNDVSLFLSQIRSMPRN
jgi:hypothetical protein